MKKTLIIIFSSIQFLVPLTRANAQVKEDHKALKSKIDNYLKAGVKNGFSGSILVAKKGEVIINKGYGMANKENNIAYTPTTVATIGSVTKQFTATAILKLVEYNKLKLTDPLSKFFKGVPSDKKEITIHQLLSHTAGFIDVIGNGDFDDIPMKHFFKTLFTTQLRHKPGSKYAYSNSGYSILARIIEITSGQEYESFLNKHLFQPAGMTHTGYFIPEWNDHLVATGYARNIFNMGTMISRFQKMKKVTWTLKGNGGIHSTTGDMYKWYQALKNGVILPKELFEKLTTPYVLEYEGGSSYYAYGWAIYNSDKNTKIISHNGGNSIFFHDFIWLPKEDVVVILFTNASSREVEVAWPIEKMIFDENYHAAPIKKNLHNLVLDVIKNNDSQQVNNIITLIKKDYNSYLKNSDNLNDLGYEVLKTNRNPGLAVALFKLNTELFPEEGNLWDSLGEGYLVHGQKEEAIKSYKKALELAPEKDCYWCKGSAKALDKLEKAK
ncbi:serine hydrolase [Aquimarina sp. 2201CG5-10]|uniref:serine hydrolase n=1 Tax=Aquimarina callyspongiae TaxID=3098150 RepID=UPI002AB44B0C|nr:serine hydrolase [Aquimarina sp. 2201CG5-10]MDY8137056.1 serine hydrolase [Aquimarina sp. 2201CG5-10]